MRVTDFVEAPRRAGVGGAHGRRAHPGVVPGGAIGGGDQRSARPAPGTRVHAAVQSAASEAVWRSPRWRRRWMHTRRWDARPFGTHGTRDVAAARRGGWDARRPRRQLRAAPGPAGPAAGGLHVRAPPRRPRHPPRAAGVQRVRAETTPADRQGAVARQGGTARAGETQVDGERDRPGSDPGSESWCSTSSPTWSSSVAWRATRSSPTGRTCSSSARSSPRRDQTAEDATPADVSDFLTELAQGNGAAAGATARRSSARRPRFAPSTGTCAARACATRTRPRS